VATHDLESDPLRRHAARKASEAARASLPPYCTDVDAATGELTATGNDWSRALFDGPFYLSPLPDHVPAASLVFVQSKDGNTGTADPTSLGGGQTDKHLVYEGLSRVAADAVMAGGGTVRGGNFIFSVWHPQLVALRASLGMPRHPIQIVATRRGVDLEGALLFNVPAVPVVLVTTHSAAASMRETLAVRPWITSILLDGEADLHQAFERLRRDGIERVSIVGGRRLATRLLDAGLIQDVYLTTSAQTGGEPDTPMYPRQLDAGLVVRKEGSGPERGVVFEHLRPLRT
jgi:riboflavin biosynthesis pyrimidine reductase